MTRISRWLFTLATAGVLSLVGCSSEPPTEESLSPNVGASLDVTDPPDPGATSIDGQVIGGGDYPGYTAEVPGTWSVNGSFVIGPGPGVLGLSVWDVGEVPRDPCHWQKSLDDPGPTVDDLVEALTTQRLRHATEPTDVTLSGYRGRYVEWSVPTDMVVTGDSEFRGCDADPSSGLRDFVSWFGNGDGERYQQVAGQVDMLWILDVAGQRLLVDATYSPDTTEADRAVLAGIVESLRFTDHAA